MPSLAALPLIGALLAGPAATEIALPSEPAPLQGVLLTPEGQVRAAALIISGSGPTDRDGNNPLGVKGDMLRLLAEGLTADGIASVRYDKRGVAQSRAAALDETALTFDRLVDDARAWVSETASRTGRPCVWLIGHSEGGLIAQSAAVDNPKVCGLVLLAAVGQKAGDQLREQLEAGLPEAIKPAAMHALDELEAGRTTDNIPGLEPLFRPSVQPYLISYFARDPIALIQAYPGPVLIGQGSTDIQVPADNADRLAAAQPRAERVIFDGANHLLRAAPMDRLANAATYGDANAVLDPRVVPTVAAFILKDR